ncbi:hypothetical protein [Streptomyces sp. Qhu_M48]|uniref:hypothetical protein n=1 Tax=Streptomyces sp. Qhu_M48 TaxID=3435889 RepID=UPI003F4FE9DB
MDLFDGELGGREEHHVGAEGSGCFWGYVVLIGLGILVVVTFNWLVDLVKGLF